MDSKHWAESQLMKMNKMDEIGELAAEKCWLRVMKAARPKLACYGSDDLLRDRTLKRLVHTVVRDGNLEVDEFSRDQADSPNRS